MHSPRARGRSAVATGERFVLFRAASRPGPCEHLAHLPGAKAHGRGVCEASAGSLPLAGRHPPHTHRGSHFPTVQNALARANAGNRTSWHFVPCARLRSGPRAAWGSIAKRTLRLALCDGGARTVSAAQPRWPVEIAPGAGCRRHWRWRCTCRCVACLDVRRPATGSIGARRAVLLALAP